MRTDNTFLRLILALSLAGILVSGWLLSVHIKFSTGQAGLTESCTIIASSGGHGCASIAVSDYSDVLGIPVAAIALGFYFTLLILTFWSMRNFQSSYESLYVGFFLSTLSILVTVAMFSISRFVVGQFCLWCSVLWMINLAMWPCFVKQLGLRWDNALAGNLELIRHKDLKLKQPRIMGSFVVGVICLIAFSIIGVAAKGLAKDEPRHGEVSLVTEYQNASQVFLEPEAFGGPQSTDFPAGKVPVMDIVEFADFQCPACRMAAQYMHPFLLKHPNEVRFTFHNFPLDGACNPYTPQGPHINACSAARYAVCAGKQGKFWGFHDQVFDNQDSLSPSFLEDVVQKLSLNMETFKACLTDPATNAQMQKEMQWADLIGLNSTPTIVINGKKLTGAKSPTELEALFRSLKK